jgi:hypothetical protein
MVTASVKDDGNLFVSSPNYNLIVTDHDQVSTSFQFWLNCSVKFIWKAGNKWNIRGCEGGGNRNGTSGQVFALIM